MERVDSKTTIALNYLSKSHSRLILEKLVAEMLVEKPSATVWKFLFKFTLSKLKIFFCQIDYMINWLDGHGSKWRFDFKGKVDFLIFRKFVEES